MTEADFTLSNVVLGKYCYLMRIIINLLLIELDYYISPQSDSRLGSLDSGHINTNERWTPKFDEP